MVLWFLEEVGMVWGRFFGWCYGFWRVFEMVVDSFWDGFDVLFFVFVVLGMVFVLFLVEMDSLKL